MDDPITRRSLHGAAELLLAGPQYRRVGTIKLLVTPGGPRAFTDAGLRIDGVDLVVGDRRLPMPGRTCAELAAAAGIDCGAPAGVYHDTSGVEPDEPLRLDPGAARWIEDCWAAGETALRRLAPEEQPILWPEHFDVAVLLDGAGYGVSPGDTFIDEPYAYVTPPTPRHDTFWSAPFGAARPVRELDNAAPEAVLAFFTEGRRRARE
jgi:hypothetical protein